MINRREYLKRMGVAGIIAGVGKSALSEQKHEAPKGSLPEQNRTKRSAVGILNWPTTTTPPPLDSFVTAIFWGLMGFCYNDQTDSPICEVGFHRGGGHHSLEIRIYRNPGCVQVFPPSTFPANIKSMTLKVDGGSGTPPNIFQESNADFDRFSGHDKDFRWMPDLDSADFYPEGYSKNKVYKTRLYMSNGTLYTRVRTDSTFMLVDANTNKRLRGFGHVAMVMAAAINVQGSEFVSFRVGNETPIELRQEPGITYQILFKNECNSCSFDPDDPNNEEARNDFHFNRKVVKVPSSRTKYSLRLEEESRPGAKPNFCIPPSKEFNDRAPCAGSAYGQTKMFP